MSPQNNAQDVIRDGFDRQNLSVLRKRFLAINADRLARMRGALSDRQQLFLDALPLLFHTNHPMMPGYVSRQTPSRISNYKPSKDDLRTGRMVAKSFTLTYDAHIEDQIYGIYVMGSVGTIAQSEGSDLDIWLCFAPGTDAEGLRELDKKCSRISEWAEELRLEVHFFLMDHDAFKQGKLSALNEESSGSAQQLLLLDEFYRTAIYIEGRLPLWWFVPSHAESTFTEYADTLLKRRFLPESSVLDFGGIATIPHGEFIGAGIWQLYKAIESPYKSVLKLLLLESYVNDFPDIRPLSLTFKALVYENDIDIDSLDSYVVIYRRIEEYLVSKKQLQRLELARRCFYFKVNKPLSRPPSRRSKSWQRLLLEKLTNEWRWGREHIAFLDGRSQWKTPDVTRERGQLVAELNHSYRFLLDFANNNGRGRIRAISSEELLILGRKLQAAFERRPGKIEWINPGISDDLSEPLVILAELDARSLELPPDLKGGGDKQRSPKTASTASRHMSQLDKLPAGRKAKNPASNQTAVRDNNTYVWTLFAASEDAPKDIAKAKAVKSAIHPIELLLWSYFNGVIQEASQFEVVTETSTLSVLEVKRVVNVVSNWIPLPLAELPHEAFHRSSEPKRVMFLLNAGQSPTPDLDMHGYQRLSDNTDALRYGGFEENLIASVDMLTQNSWDEISIRRYERGEALVEGMQEYLQLCLPGTHQHAPELRIECIGSSHSTTITHRVQAWIDEILACFYAKANTSQSRFLFQMSNAFFMMQFRGMTPCVDRFKNEAQLIDFLAQEQSRYSAIVLDSYAFLRHPLKAIANKCREASIDVFYRRFDIGMEVYISDEKGSLSHLVYRRVPGLNSLKSLHRFLRSAIQRQTQMSPEFDAHFGIYPVNFYEVVKQAHGEFSLSQKSIPPEARDINKFDVKAVAHLDEQNELVFDYACEQQEFSASVFGDQLTLVTANYILSRRTSDDHYPVYLTDLDLSLVANVLSKSGKLQVSHYLQVKNNLEFQLNKSLGVLLKV